MAQTSSDIKRDLAAAQFQAKLKSAKYATKKDANLKLNGSDAATTSQSTDKSIQKDKKSKLPKWVNALLPWNWGKSASASTPTLTQKYVPVVNCDPASANGGDDEKKLLPSIGDLKAKALSAPNTTQFHLDENNFAEPGSLEGSTISSEPSSRINSTNSSVYIPSKTSSLYVSAKSTISWLSNDTPVAYNPLPSVTIDESANTREDVPATDTNQAVTTPIDSEETIDEDESNIKNATTPLELSIALNKEIKSDLILILFAITGIDLRPKPKLTADEEAKEKANELSLPLKIFSYVTSVVVAIASGMITAVAVAALHIPASLIVLIGLAGYRVNLLVYKSAVDYLLGNFRDFGKGFKECYTETFNQDITINLVKRIGLAVLAGIKQGFIKGFFQDSSSPTGEMSRTKKILTGVGIFLSFAGGASLAAMTFTSATSALVHIFALIGLTSLGVFPPVLAGVMAVIALVAMTALMYKSIHIAIKENAHIKLLNFLKDLKHSSNATTSEIVKHYVISCCKVLFIAAGVALAIIATIATLGAWQASMVKILTGIPGAYVKACEIASYILVFGLTAAGRIPMVIDKAASVFSTIGGFVGRSLFTLGEKAASLFGYKPQYQKLNDESSQKSLWDSIKGECTDPQTNKFSGWNTFIFASKTTAQVLAIGLVAGIVIGSIFLNAGGNGAVADEGASFLTKILNFFHIYPSTEIQSDMPFFTGGLVSLILGLDGARTTYLPQETEMKKIPKDSSQKTLATLSNPTVKNVDPNTAPSPQSTNNIKSPAEISSSGNTQSTAVLNKVPHATQSWYSSTSSAWSSLWKPTSEKQEKKQPVVRPVHLTSDSPSIN